MAVDVPQGATFAHASFNAELTSINHTGASRPSVKTTNLATTSADAFMPGDLVDYGSLEIGYNYDVANTGTKIPPITSASTTFTVTLPGGKIITGSGFVTDSDFWTIEQGDESLITGTMSMKITGVVTFSTT